MSRKLIFVSGLLACFSLHLLIAEPERNAILHSAYPDHEFVRHMRLQLAQTPLEILASVVNKHQHLSGIGLRLFDAYDEFLGILSDSEKRKHLDKLVAGSEMDDPVYRQMQHVSHSFRDALIERGSPSLQHGGSAPRHAVAAHPQRRGYRAPPAT